MLATSLQYFRSKRQDLHVILVTQLTSDRPKDTGAAGVFVITNDNASVLVKADIAAVSAAQALNGADDNCLNDIALLYAAARGALAHRANNYVTDVAVLACGAAENTDYLQFLCMGIVVALGIIAYIILTLLVNRSVPANPDTHYTGTNGVSVYYDSSIWKVCQMTEDSTLGTVLELATADSADGEDYEAVLLQRGTADSYADFIDASEKDLKQAYGVIKPRKVNLTVDGAEVEAVRCDIQAYYAVLATITYPSGDVVYVSGLTKLASINDIVNLVESVTLS